MMSRCILLLFSVICVLWYSYMISNYHKNFIAQKSDNVTEKIRVLESLYKPYLYTKGNFKSKPLAYQLAMSYYENGNIVLADSLFSEATEAYPHEYYLLRDYSKFVLREYDNLDKAILLAEQAYSNFKYDKELNLLLAECYIVDDKLAKAYDLVQSVYHNEYVHRSKILLNELFYREFIGNKKYAFDKRNKQLKYHLGILDRDEKDSLRNQSIKFSIEELNSLESDMVVLLPQSEFGDYVKRRYTNFIHFYSSVWTRDLIVSEETKNKLEIIFSKVYSQIKWYTRRLELDLVEGKDYQIKIDTLRKRFQIDLATILDDTQMDSFNYVDKFKRLGGQ